MKLSTFKISEQTAVTNGIPSHYTAGLAGCREIEVVDGGVVVRQTDGEAIFISPAGVGVTRSPGRPPGTGRKQEQAE